MKEKLFNFKKVSNIISLGYAPINDGFVLIEIRPEDILTIILERHKKILIAIIQMVNFVKVEIII